MISHPNSIFLWNCRGAASPSFFRHYKQYLEACRPEIVVIMETRVDPGRLQRTFNLLGFDGVEITVASLIWVLWDPAILGKDRCMKGTLEFMSVWIEPYVMMIGEWHFLMPW